MLRTLTQHQMTETTKRSTSAVAAAYLCSYVGIERNFAGSQPRLDWKNPGP